MTAAGPRALVPLVLATMAAQALIVVLAPTLVAIATDLDATVSTVGQARSVTAVASVATSALLVSRGAHVGVRAMIGLGSAVSVVSCGVVAAAPTVELFLAAHLLVGVGLALLLSGGFAGMAVFERRAWAAGYLASANAAAWIIVNPVVGVITGAGSWRWAMVVPAVIALASLAAVPRVLAVAAVPRVSLTAPLRDRSARRWLLAELAAYTSWTAMLTYTGAFFIDGLGVSEPVTGWLLAGAAAAFLLTSSRAGVLARRLPVRVLATAAALTMAVLLPLTLGAWQSAPWVFALFCLTALAAGARTPASAALGIEQLPGHPATMMAARTAVTQAGYLLGSVVAGAVIAGPGYRALGLVLAAVMVVSALLVRGVSTAQPGSERGVT